MRQVLWRFDGTVTAVGRKTLTVEVRDRTVPTNSPEQWVFDKRKLPRGFLRRASEGRSFEVQFTVRRSTQEKARMELRWLPVKRWTQVELEEIHRVAKERAERFSALFETP